MTNSLCGRIDRFKLEHRSYYETAIYLDAHPLAVEHLRLLLKERPDRGQFAFGASAATTSGLPSDPRARNAVR